MAGLEEQDWPSEIREKLPGPQKSDHLNHFLPHYLVQVWPTCGSPASEELRRWTTRSCHNCRRLDTPDLREN